MLRSASRVSQPVLDWTGFGSAVRILASIGMLAGQCACTELKVRRLHLGDSTVVATSADVRLVTQRMVRGPSADGRSERIVTCAEPSPDVAFALSKAIEADAHATIPQGASGGVHGEYRTSEAGLALAGRTAAIVALRDGLSRACEAYANGVLGPDGYALILSQYGDLLVTMILGDSAGNGAATPFPASQLPASIPAQGDPASGGSQQPQGAATAPPPEPSNVPPPSPANVARQGPSAGRQGGGSDSSTAPSEPGSRDAGTALGIAKAYYDHESDRLMQAMLVVCTVQSERPVQNRTGMEPSVPRPEQASYMDGLCRLHLETLQAKLDDMRRKARSGSTGQR